MRTIKIIAVLLGAILLMTSCYTQLALVERDVYQKDDYYYPPSDTLYSDQGAPLIVQNFYDDPYDFYFGMHFGLYTDWWLWSDWYYPYRPYWGVFYPIRPVNPWLWYPGYIVYDPFYWDYYYDYWYWNTGPVYTTPYGPRPFAKGGSLIRGGGSKRVRISQTPGNDHGVGGSAFLPTRTSGSVISSSDSRRSIRKSTGSVAIRQNDSRTTIRKGTASRTVIRKGSSDRSTKSKKTVIRRTNRHERKYYPITKIRSTKPKSTVRQPKATKRSYLKTKSRSTNNNRKRSNSSYSNTRSSSGYSPSFNTPSRSTSSNRSSGSYRSSSSSSRSSSRSATRRSSSRSGSRRK